MKDESRLKERIWEEIDEHRKDIVTLCSDMIKIPSDNPPGDTPQLASFLEEYLEHRDITVEQYEPLEGSL